MSSKAKAKQVQPTVTPLSTQEIQQNYNRLQNELQTLAGKIGELEQEAEEHSLVLTTLDEALAEEPDRKCFRLVGGVLVERTVKDVVPALQTNRGGILKVISTLAEQYKTRDEEFETFKRDYNIRPAAAG
ncbi:Probable prefoldin subunit [Sparassis crispa]|uniref:Probable prefoldin subunit n=1 Tax=Sparassis crispa TaxID=139825 RepID=A0A401GCK4_9APHY|nr:Probable prefoldin subunit [Sparassis crispa]GBE79904.1 Probable prefoldin subunit [Sparassis crispa]